MKTLFIILPIFLISCQGHKFNNGDCVQKPDENIVWKLSDIKENSATAVQSGQSVPEMAKQIELNSSWIKTKCRD